MPAAEVGCRAISTLKKCHEHRFRVARFPYHLVGQQELAEIPIEICFFGARLRLAEALRRGVRIRIKCCEIGSSTPRPESSGRHLVTICLAGYVVGQCRYATWMERSETRRETCH